MSHLYEPTDRYFPEPKEFEPHFYPNHWEKFETQYTDSDLGSEVGSEENNLEEKEGK